MLRKFMRIVVYMLIVIVLVGGVGFVGTVQSQTQFWINVRKEPIPVLQEMEKPKHDPGKPTVAVLLGSENTEGLDFTIPYQIFSMTGAYNVYAVAADNKVRTLTGGLDVIPHYSFEELDALLGRSADIIAIPYMTMNKPGTYDPLREWILKHKDTTLLSICAGADNLAMTGLLNGKLGATHWQTMPVLTRKFPDVNWVVDRRYVTNGPKMISSAGISSGIDATLYVISQQLGELAAAKVAREMKYPTYHFVQNPVVEPFYADFRYITYILNNAFHWGKTKAGVMLHDGVEEMALASTFDIYSDTGTTTVLAIAGSEQPIVTKHGLRVVPRRTIADAPAFDKMIVPGTQARSLAAAEVSSWNAKSNAAPLQFVHNDSPDRFLFEVQLEDLAKQEDLLTAKHALKRLEYRANEIDLQGRLLPLETYGALLLTLGAAILAANYVDRRFLKKHAQASGASGTAQA
jgi:AraC family transcriptional regulator, transcriptional activator FtrA